MSHDRARHLRDARIARIGQALAAPARLALLDLLAQRERTVESLARDTGLSTANASQHLQVLRAAGLVEPRKAGLFVHYRLAGDRVVHAIAALRALADDRRDALDGEMRQELGDRAAAEAIGLDELLDRLGRREVVVLDTRPVEEYEAGHIPGALSMPVGDLQRHLRRLPKRRRYVAYCRGPYCVYADRAVELLRQSGRHAERLLEGFPEWRAAGLPVERGPGAA